MHFKVEVVADDTPEQATDDVLNAGNMPSASKDDETCAGCPSKDPLLG